MIHSLMHKNDLDITHEDTITSTIIGTLLHLPDQLQAVCCLRIRVNWRAMSSGRNGIQKGLTIRVM